MGLASFYVGSPSLSQPSSFTRAWDRLCLEDIGGVNGDAHSLAKFSISLAQGCHVWLDHPHNPLCIPQTVAFEE